MDFYLKIIKYYSKRQLWKDIPSPQGWVHSIGFRKLASLIKSTNEEDSGDAIPPQVKPFLSRKCFLKSFSQLWFPGRTKAAQGPCTPRAWSSAICFAFLMEKDWEKQLLIQQATKMCEYKEHRHLAHLAHLPAPYLPASKVNQAGSRP